MEIKLLPYLGPTGPELTANCPSRTLGEHKKGFLAKHGGDKPDPPSPPTAQTVGDILLEISAEASWTIRQLHDYATKIVALSNHVLTWGAVLDMLARAMGYAKWHAEFDSIQDTEHAFLPNRTQLPPDMLQQRVFQSKPDELPQPVLQPKPVATIAPAIASRVAELRSRYANTPLLDPEATAKVIARAGYRFTRSKSSTTNKSFAVAYHTALSRQQKHGQIDPLVTRAQSLFEDGPVMIPDEEALRRREQLEHQLRDAYNSLQDIEK